MKVLIDMYKRLMGTEIKEVVEPVINFSLPMLDHTDISIFPKLQFKEFSRFLIFLDFDGVIHPNCKESFEHVPLLEQLLQEHTDVGIILSTNWREGAELSYMERLLGPVISARIEGATPVDHHSRGYVREKEVTSFVSYFGIKDYVVLDDDPRNDLFSPQFTRLVQTNISYGLTRSDIERLKTLLFRK